MRLLLLSKWDQHGAKYISQTCADMMPPCADTLKVAICEDCRHHNQALTEEQYFLDLCRRLGRNNTRVIVRRVSLIQPILLSLESLKTCDVFYMCGGDPGQRVPTALVDALSAWHSFCRGGGDYTLPGTPESIAKMCVLQNRVQCDEILYMGSCMGAMMAGANFCQGSSGFGMDIKLFDFM